MKIGSLVFSAFCIIAFCTLFFIAPGDDTPRLRAPAAENTATMLTSEETSAVKIRYFAFGEVIDTVFVGVGECPGMPEEPLLSGFEFLGWYSDEALCAKVDFEKPVFSDLDVFASFSLKAPSFSLTDQEVVYDGEVHDFGLDALWHEMGEGINYSFFWYKDGELFSESERLSLKNVSDSGEYFCKIVAFFDGYSVEISTGTVRFSVLPASVALPEKLDVYYSGNAVFPKDSLGLWYASGGFLYINSGQYTLSVVLSDPENFVFEDGGKGATLTLNILPARVRVRIGEVKLYLFDEYEISGYEILGNIRDGDELGLQFLLLEDRAVAYTQNSNYEIISEGGTVIRSKLPSPKKSASILSFALIFSVLILSLVIIKEKRDKIRLCRAGKNLKGRFEALTSQDSTPKEGWGEGSEFEFFLQPMSPERADALISDFLASSLLLAEREYILTEGTKRAYIDLDTLCENFAPGERVDVNILKKKGLVSPDISYIKLRARGFLDKPLFVYANSFTPQAIKMLSLTGGGAYKCVSVSLGKIKKA